MGGSSCKSSAIVNGCPYLRAARWELVGEPAQPTTARSRNARSARRARQNCAPMGTAVRSGEVHLSDPRRTPGSRPQDGSASRDALAALSPVEDNFGPRDLAAAGRVSNRTDAALQGPRKAAPQLQVARSMP